MFWSFRNSKGIYVFSDCQKLFYHSNTIPVYLSQGNEVQWRRKLDKNEKMSVLETCSLKELAVRISVAARTA